MHNDPNMSTHSNWSNRRTVYTTVNHTDLLAAAGARTPRAALLPLGLGIATC